MRYMLLIYDREADWAAMSEQERGQIFQQYTEFSDGIRKSGHYRASDPLQPVSTATTVRVKNGKPITTDGPFAETREQLGGYYIIEAKNLDEATAIAA
ncbi:MAG TPA: YciI family protein, partial [Thermoanaerobaculia bacterium]